MTQLFEDEKVVPVTLVEAGPCKITRVRSTEKDGYEAIQMGYEEITKKNKMQKSQKGKEFSNVREFRASDPEQKAGDTIDVSVFEVGDMVKVSGISKGKGTSRQG